MKMHEQLSASRGMQYQWPKALGLLYKLVPKRHHSEGRACWWDQEQLAYVRPQGAVCKGPISGITKLQTL